jgi:putative tricarboxylic transport membrane protein
MEEAGCVDRRVDFGISLAVIGLGIVIFVSSALARVPTVTFDLIGPYGFARVVAGIFIIAGSVLLVRQVMALRAGMPPEAVAQGNEDEPGYPASARRAAALMAATFAYPILLDPIGYSLSSFLYILAGLLIYNERKWWGIPLALVYALGTFWIFAVVLRVPLPGGPVEQVLLQLGLIDRVR